MRKELPTSITDYLSANLEGAVSQLANTWRPNDRAYRADVYRQIMMNLSYSYFVYFHADAEHPDWSPLWNPVYTLQPNPDDIYLYSPIRGDLTYRVSGNRGTVKMLTFTTQRGFCGMVDEVSQMGEFNDLDDRDLEIDDDGEFELILSANRPPNYTGNWAPIGTNADTLMVRYRSYDWGSEISPQLSIECLDPVPPKPRLTPENIAQRLQLMAKFPARMTKLFFAMQNAVRDAVGVNVFQPAPIDGALSKQIYLPAIYELNDDEALIIETDLPKKRHYWNIQLNDPYYNAVEFVYRLSSLNGHTAKLSSDGKLRAVIALEDPGVPNWLDPAGFSEGTIYGRWYDCDSCPTPRIIRVPLTQLRNHLPPDTAVISPQQREEELKARVRAAQRRRRW